MISFKLIIIHKTEQRCLLFNAIDVALHQAIPVSHKPERFMTYRGMHVIYIIVISDNDWQ